MRLGIFSDMHGNYHALDMVLQELTREGVDQLVCLGDVGSLGPEPHRVVERLRAIQCPCVLGNTDAWLLTPPVATETDAPVIFEINAWCAAQLTPEDLLYLQALPPVLEMRLDSLDILCYHGSPRSFDDVISGVTPDADLKEMVSGYSANIFMGGHTHIPMLRRYENIHLLNFGSAGFSGVNAGGPDLPKNSNVHWAEYGILSVEADQFSIDFRRLDLDVSTMLAHTRELGMPHFDWWASKWATP
jgi:putative phosphoesterase